MCMTNDVMCTWSPRQQLSGWTVLLTGSLGFLGSVVLEQILRLTEAKRVYLLVRNKKHLTASQRVQKLLCDPLFHRLHEEASNGRSNAFKRVQAVEGDLTQPGLGLSATDAEVLQREVNVIIHCAADIELDAAVHKTLRANYVGTRNLLDLAADMPKLHVFLHTSTYFVNSHLPRHSVVKEEIYRLPIYLPTEGMNQTDFTAAADSGTNIITHDHFVTAMLTLPAEEADRQTAMVMQRLNFGSTYAFGKYLTELLVEGYPLPNRVSKAMVRPSLISSIAGEPYPGYVAGYGGPAGFTMGYAVGFFPHITSVAYGSDYIMDLIPADVVAAVILTAAAAGLQDSSNIRGTDYSGEVKAETNAAAAELQDNSSRTTNYCDSAEVPTETGPAVAIYHAASAESYPCQLKQVFEFISDFWKAHPPPMCLPATRYVTYTHEQLQPNPLLLQLGRYVTLFKIWGVSWLLWALGKTKEARLLSNAYKAFGIYNSTRYDRSITCAVDNVRALQAKMSAQDRQLLPVIWEASVMDWADYGYLVCAGIRSLLFRVKDDSLQPKAGAPRFVSWPLGYPELLHAMSLQPKYSSHEQVSNIEQGDSSSEQISSSCLATVVAEDDACRSSLLRGSEYDQTCSVPDVVVTLREMGK